jgi:hypothetical protein
MLADDTLDELAEMEGWSVEGEVASFRPFDAGWSALVMFRTVYGKAHSRWHMSLIDPSKRCREVSIRSRLADDATWPKAASERRTGRRRRERGGADRHRAIKICRS